MQHFISDPGTDVVGSLSLAARLSATVREKPSDWKWALIAVHSAMQSALVLVLSGSDGAGAYKKMSQERYREWITGKLKEGELPDVRLAGFLDLFKWAKDPAKMDAIPIQTSEDIDKWINLLSIRRDNLVHHEDVTWIMETNELARCVDAGLHVVEQLLNHKRILTSIDLDDAIQTGICKKSINAVRDAVRHHFTK